MYLNVDCCYYQVDQKLVITRCQSLMQGQVSMCTLCDCLSLCCPLSGKPWHTMQTRHTCTTQHPASLSSIGQRIVPTRAVLSGSTCTGNFTFGSGPLQIYFLWRQQLVTRWQICNSKDPNPKTKWIWIPQNIPARKQVRSTRKNGGRGVPLRPAKQ